MSVQMMPKSPFRPQQQLRKPTFQPGDRADFTEIKDVLQALQTLMDPNEDIAALQEAEEWIAKQEQIKSETLDKLYRDIRTCEQQLNEAMLHTHRPSGTLSLPQHENLLLDLESHHITIGKQVNEESEKVTRKEAEVMEMKKEREVWNTLDVGKDWEESEEAKKAKGRALRIKLIQDAGFHLNAEQKTVLIRNDRSDNVQTFRLDDSNTKDFTANMLWQLANE